MSLNSVIPSATPDSDTFSGILDASLNGIIAYEALRDETGQIHDFRALLINQAAQKVLHLPDTKPGWQMLVRFPATRDRGMFDRYREVVQTGEAIRFETPYQADGLDGWYDVAVGKLNDGFVITFNDITVQKRDSLAINDRNELFQSILDTSFSSILIYEAMRDETGEIQDFRLKLANPRAEAKMRNRFKATADQRTLLTINPDARRTGQFNRYVEVMETGQSVRQEHLYPNFNTWYDTIITRSGDGVVITATNITEQKELISQQEQHNNFMKAMLDGSLNGLLLLEPVYDDQQTIVDFRVQAANQSIEQLSGVRPDQAIGRLMLTIYPGIKEAGYFDMYVRVVQIGKPERLETYYEDEKGLKGWFEVSATCQENKVIVTFSNTTKFRQAEQELKQAANHIQAVIDNSQTGIFVFSPVYDESGKHVDFRFKTINRMVAAMVGQTPDVVTGTVASDWFISYRETGLFDKYRYTYETGEEQRFEINYNVDGFDVWFDVKAIKMNDDVLVTFTDFTNLKQTQLAQEKQADLLYNVLNGSQNGIMSFEAIRDASGVITDFQFKTINQASEQIVGVPIDTMMQTTLLSIFPGNVESGLFHKYVYTVETGEPTRTEVEYKADGLDFWLDISARKLGDGFVVTFTDTSVVKRVSQAVEKSATELQTVIDMSQTGIFLFGPVFDEAGELIDFRYRVANKTVAAFAGQDSTAAPGTLASAWFPDYKQNGLFDCYKDLYLTGGQTKFDFHYKGDGVDVWVNIVATKINDEVLVTFTDFTALKRLQQQLENSVVDLQNSNKNLEQFAYVASHDLQEPLRKIQQFSDILQTSYADVLDESGRGMLTRMQSAADRMRTLIKDVLAYSRITTKRENARSLNLNALIGDVLTDLETAIADKQAVVYRDLLPIVLGDAAQMRQLFQNLISNALKFNKPGRQPQLRLRSYTQQGCETGLLLPPADETKLFHRIELSDNGIGFDPAHADKIFQVFQRLHNRNEYAGTGIGLAIVQKVVENHQGHIRAEGKPGEGATFIILLPA